MALGYAKMAISVGIVCTTVTMMIACDSSVIVDEGAGTPTATTTMDGLAITPNFGVVGGGGRITVTGWTQSSIPTILIGESECSGTEMDGQGRISCVIPPGILGVTDVEFKLGGARVEILRKGFTYLPALNLMSVTPGGGRLMGGTRITLTGVGFGPEAVVLIGAAACTDVTLTDHTELSCTTPEKGGAGQFAITVINANGDKASLSDAFSIFEAPTVTAISPTSGPVAGGTTVSVAGSSFHDGVTVLIGASVCNDVTVESDVLLTCVTSTGSSGVKNVTVVDLSGQQGALESGYTYLAPPAIVQVSPASGKAAGGDTLRILGSNFVNGAVVRVGTALCSNVTVAASDTITCQTPVGAVGVADVTVTNPDGQAALLDDGFQYFVASSPSVSSVSPAAGVRAGGEVVTINGANFATGASVTIDGYPCTSVTRVSAAKLTCTTPAGNTGAKTVIVVNPDGQFASLASGFTFNDGSAPTVSSVLPNYGSVAGGTVVTIRGSSFQPGVSMTIGGYACTSLTRVSDTQLTCTTPAGSFGSKTIIVTNPDGQLVTATSPNVFTYVNGFGPTAAVISPNYGSVAGGENITITGANFMDGAVILIAQTSGYTITCNMDTDNNGTYDGFISSSSVRCKTPPSSAGTRNVTVVNPDGQTSAALVYNYTSVMTPIVTSIVPNYGAPAGGYDVTINGSQFVSGSIAQIGGANCTTTTYVSPTKLTCRIPAGKSGQQFVNVINPDGLAHTGTASTPMFFYTNGMLPQISAVVPTYVNAAGGDTITVLGSNFMDGASLQLMNTGTTAVIINCNTTYVNSTQLTCVAPAGGYGGKDIQVTNPDGQVSNKLTNGIYYLGGYAPVISSITPNTGSITGGTLISIIGSGFSTGGTSQITIGNMQCVTGSGTQASGVQTSTHATCLTPPGIVGTATVKIVNPDGQATTATNNFTYTVTNSFRQTLVGGEDNAEFGTALAALGDINGDSVPDVAISSLYAAAGAVARAGKVTVYSGQTMAPLCTVRSPSPETNGQFGFSLAVSKVVATGALAYLVVGEPGATVNSKASAGKVHVMSLSACTGGAATVLDTATTSLQASSEAANARYGHAVAAGRVVLASTKSDIIVGEPYAPSAGTDRGLVYIYEGDTWASQAIGGTLPQTDYANLGFAIATACLDGNSNGLEQVIIGEPGNSNGRIHILKPGALNWDAANQYITTLIAGASAGGRLGFAIANAGKVSADLKDDFVVSEPWASSGVGNVKFYSAPATGATATLLYTASGTADYQFGRALASMGDINADGRADVIVGVPAETPTQQRGRVTVFSGLEASLGRAIKTFDILGLENWSALGRAVMGIGDINGDSRPDALVAEPWAPAGGPRRGRVMVLLAP